MFKPMSATEAVSETRTADILRAGIRTWEAKGDRPAGQQYQCEIRGFPTRNGGGAEATVSLADLADLMADAKAKGSATVRITIWGNGPRGQQAVAAAAPQVVYAMPPAGLPAWPWGVPQQPR